MTSKFNVIETRFDPLVTAHTEVAHFLSVLKKLQAHQWTPILQLESKIYQQRKIYFIIDLSFYYIYTEWPLHQVFMKLRQNMVL